MYGKLKRFPLGSITAGGFLREQILRNINGMGGHMAELEPDMLAKPFLAKKAHNAAWGESDQNGWAAEIAGNYWSGLIQAAFTMGDEDLIARVTEWVSGVLANRREDGYIGTYLKPDSNIFEDYNAWGTASAMRGLLAFSEATGRKDVFDAVCDCMRWFVKNWDGDRKTVYAGQFIIEIMIACYERTGDSAFLKFSEDYERFLASHDLYRNSARTFLTSRIRYNSNHTAGLGATSRIPALIYSANGNPDLLRASEKVLGEVREKCTHITGGPVSSVEYLGPVSSIAESEYCSFTFFNMTYSYMSAITGNAKYGDYMEEIFYNAAQGARKKDERAIAYLSAPNQFFAGKNSSSAVRDMQAYSPCYPVSCCPVNAVALLPEFVRGMMLYNEKGDIYMTAYGPCELHWQGIHIAEKTQYPFRDTVDFSINAPQQEFSFFLKIPGWCKAYTVCVNGKEETAVPDGNGYAELRHRWERDTVSVRFRMETEVIRIDDSDSSKKYPVAFRRGALVYAMPIATKWVPYPGNPQTPLPDGWSWFEALPDYEEPKLPDGHLRQGLKRYRTEYNVAVDEAMTANEVTVEEKDTEGYPWEVPPICLHIKGYRAPYLCANYPERTFEPFGDRQPVMGEQDITLIPYGCTNLRMTYFPRADLNDRVEFPCRSLRSVVNGDTVNL